MSNPTLGDSIALLYGDGLPVFGAIIKTETNHKPSFLIKDYVTVSGALFESIMPSLNTPEYSMVIKRYFIKF